MQYNTKLHKEEYFAIIGKKRYPMPSAFKDMYDDEHLDIVEVTTKMPELFDVAEPTFYIPRRTV